jgi:hypothetical protein
MVSYLIFRPITLGGVEVGDYEESASGFERGGETHSEIGGYTGWNNNSHSWFYRSGDGNGNDYEVNEQYTRLAYGGRADYSVRGYSDTKIASRTANSWTTEQTYCFISIPDIYDFGTGRIVSGSWTRSQSGVVGRVITFPIYTTKLTTGRDWRSVSTTASYSTSKWTTTIAGNKPTITTITAPYTDTFESQVTYERPTIAITTRGSTSLDYWYGVSEVLTYAQDTVYIDPRGLLVYHNLDGELVNNYEARFPQNFTNYKIISQSLTTATTISESVARFPFVMYTADADGLPQSTIPTYKQIYMPAADWGGGEGEPFSLISIGQYGQILNHFPNEKADFGRGRGFNEYTTNTVSLYKEDGTVTAPSQPQEKSTSYSFSTSFDDLNEDTGYGGYGTWTYITSHSYSATSEGKKVNNRKKYFIENMNNKFSELGALVAHILPDHPLNYRHLNDIEWRGGRHIASPLFETGNTYTTYNSFLTINGAEVTIHQDSADESYYYGRHLQNAMFSFTGVQKPSTAVWGDYVEYGSNTDEYTSITVSRSLGNISSSWVYLSGTSIINSSGSGVLSGSSQVTVGVIPYLFDGQFVYGGAVWPHKSYTELLAGIFYETTYSGDASGSRTTVYEGADANTAVKQANDVITVREPALAFFGNGARIKEYYIQAIQESYQGLWD